ncbi:hypothetical protein FRC19_003688 [Serendipita sp. 401]|nr:hypothetical protein FRC19_003688 [Serendipita sp. 401]
MYASEKEDNFRWVAKWVATTSMRVLSKEDRVDERVDDAVSALAEFAEIAHGSMDPAWILNPQNRKILGRKDFPLADYKALGLRKDGELRENIILVDSFKGNIGNLQGYTALRMSQTATRLRGSRSTSRIIKPQLILAFSGTSNLIHGIYNLMTVPVQYQPVSNTESHHDWRVHDGFQRVYQSIREPAIRALYLAIKKMEEAHKGDWDLVITGHSLGTAVASLFLLDLMRSEDALDEPGTSSAADAEMPILPSSTKVTIAKFGPPRVVNPGLVVEYHKQVQQFRHRRGDDAFTDWAIIGHMDGVSAVPPMKFGYAHLCRKPFYLYHGKLYRIQEGEHEHSLFTVDDVSSPPLHPKGGHNYYGARDMERLQRRMKALMVDVMAEGTNSYQGQPAQLGASWNSATSSRGVGGASNIRAPGSQQNDPLWVRAYLEREKEEECAWATRPPETGRSHWGLLRSILPIMRFS